MGLFSLLLLGAGRPQTPVTKAPRRRGVARQTRVEPLEARQMMAGDTAPPEVLLGSVYFEEATGDDSAGDVLQVSFVGGAAGTTLDRLIIDGDKLGDGLTVGDVFYDTADGGRGAFEAVGYELISSAGFTITGVSVLDGGSQIEFTFDGFDAGEKLVFSIDADEAQFIDGGTVEANSLVEGAEFQRSKITGFFTATGYVDLKLGAVYWDDFDGRRDTAEAATGLALSNLPDDTYDPGHDYTDRTAGAVAHAPQVPLARLSGYVYHDRDDDGVYDRGPLEQPIAGVTLELLDAAGNGTGVTTVTGPDGFYEFVNLTAGTYGVRETQPGGWIDGKDTPGSHGGTSPSNDVLRGAVLNFGDRGVEYNFGELLPGSIAGRVMAFNSPDCDPDNPDILVAGVRIDLLDAQGALIESTTTDSQGRYKFDNLPPGEYQVREHQPSDYFDGDEHVGSEGGSATTDDLIRGIRLGSDVDAVEYDFCEHVGACLSGYVYHDRNDNGEFESAENPISGVTLMLLRADGTDTGLRAVTTNNGFYKFSDLPPGTYTVMELHPAGWLDGQDTPGTHGGNRPANDKLGQITLDFGDDAQQYNFGELLPGSISGRVMAFTTPECDPENPEILVEGVKIELLDAAGAVIATTFTNAQGEYAFNNLRPGFYSVRETQPAPYLDGDEHIGSAGGDASVNDVIREIRLDSEENAVRYDFCEHVGACLSGYVYHDRNDNGLFESGEEPIGGVTIMLLDATGVDTGLRAVTGVDGYYEFCDLTPGTYTLMEVQPTGWLDGRDTPGDKGGSNTVNDKLAAIPVEIGDMVRNNNFGEFLPGSIRGKVVVSTDPECDPNDGEPLIAGVRIDLLNAQGAVIATTFTDAEGRYAFTGLRPGHYSVVEHQPEDYFHGDQHVGTGGGSAVEQDHIADIEVGSDEHHTEYDFCETPPASLAGYVFIDGAPIQSLTTPTPAEVAALRDGLRTPDDTPLAGVVLELRNGISGDPIFGEQALPGYYPDGPIRTVTDVHGFYEFDGLPAGTYAVVEVQPTGLIDGNDTPGSLGGFAVNVDPAPLNGQVQPTVAPNPAVQATIQQFRTQFGNNALVRIALQVGQRSVENNFSEARSIPNFVPPRERPPVDPPYVPTPRNFIPPGALPPLLPPAKPAIPLLGGASDPGYTWHLSVVNAGRPRTLLSRERLVALTSGRVDAAAWENITLRQAEWTLLHDEDQADSHRKFLFGAEDAVPVAGDWNGDGVTDIGVYAGGAWWLDLNGNGRWDRGDLWAKLGTKKDRPVTGDWDGDGKDDIGIYGPEWPRDPHAIAVDPGLPDAENFPTRLADKAKNVPPTKEDATSGGRLMRRGARGERRADLIDHVFHYGVEDDVPVAGDWNGDGIRSIGVYRGGVWMLDQDGDGRLTDDDPSVPFGQAGDVPVVGDWNGDSQDDLGVFRAGRFLVDVNGDRRLDARDAAFDLGQAGDLPVAGDWDGDGRDEPAVYRPGAETPRISQRVN